MACYYAQLDPDAQAQLARSARRCDYGAQGEYHDDETWTFQNQMTDVYHAFNSPANRRRIEQALVRAGFAPGQGFSRDEVQLVMDQVYSEDPPYAAFDILDSDRGRWSRAKGGRYVQHKVDQLTHIAICRLVNKMALARWSYHTYMRDISTPGIRGVYEIEQPREVQCRRDQITGSAFLLPGEEHTSAMGGPDQYRAPPPPLPGYVTDTSSW